MRFAIAMAFLLSLTSCGYFADNRSAVVFSRGRVFSKAELSYSYLKQNLFSKRCESCHNEGRPRHGIRVDTYEQVKLNLNAIIQSTLVKKTMPLGEPLSEREMLLLEAWIEAGAPDRAAVPTEADKPSEANTEQPTPPPTPEPLPETADFAFIRGPLFQKHACYECHLKGQRAGDVVIDELSALLDPQYRAVVPGQPDESVLVQVLETEGRKRMPPISSGEGLSVEEVKLVRDWIARGALER